MDALCRLYWESFVLHYALLPVGGPLLGFLFVRTGRARGAAGGPQLLLILFIVLVATLWLSFRAPFFCEARMFGELSDDPGDIGLIFVSLPLFLVFSLVSASASVFVIVRSTVRRRDPQANGS